MLLLCIGCTEWFHVTLKRELTTPVHCRRHQGISKDEQLIQREFFNLGQGHQGCRCLSQDSNILQQSVWSGLMGDGCFQMIRTFEDTMQHDVADSWGLKEAYVFFFSWSHGVVFLMDTVKMCQLRFAKDCQQNTSTSGAKPARSDWLKMAKDSSRVESLKMTKSEGAGVERRKMFQKFCLQNFQLARERDGKKGGTRKSHDISLVLQQSTMAIYGHRKSLCCLWAFFTPTCSESHLGLLGIKRKC